MKIALICPYDIAYPGGVTNHVTHFAHYARKMGHEVTVIAPASRKAGYENVVSAGKVIPVPIPGGTVPRLGFFLRNPVKRLFIREKYDVIHVHEPGTPLLGYTAVGSAPPGSVLVATFHSNTPYNFLLRTLATLFKLSGLTNKRAAKVDSRIAVSEAAKRHASRYLPDGEYFIIPNGVDVERFSPEAEPIGQYFDGKVNILFVGRLGNNEKRKGLQYLVSAFNKLHSAHPETRLLIVGPGSPDYKTKRIVAAVDNKIAKDIVFVGRVSAEELPRYYATADIFCSPAVEGESFGMVLIEAMASGKPVVASNIDGYRNVILDSDGQADNNGNPDSNGVIKAETGVLVPPRDPLILAVALEELVTNKPLRTKMGRKGRQIAVENFSWQKIAQRILEVYRQAITEKKTRRNKQ